MRNVLGDASEGLVLLLIIQKIRTGSRDACRALGIRFGPNCIKTFRVGKRQRVDQNVLNQAEHGAACTDAESQREHGQKSESRRFAELA